MSTKRAKHNRDHVVTFRIDDGSRGRLQHELRRPIAGIRSAHQFARKVLVDFLDGRLVYTNAEDRAIDPAVAASRDELRKSGLARVSAG